MPKRGISRFSIKNLLSHSTEKLRRGTLLCFTKFLVSKKFKDKGGRYQDFRSKIFCLTVPKNFEGEPFSVSLISGTEKVWIRGGGGGYHDFASKIFLSHTAEKFRRGIL